MRIKAYLKDVTNGFNSILRSDYIALDDLKNLENLELYYVDYFNNMNGLLQKQDNFICGRRGTGKTTLLYRSYYECLKSVSPKVSSNDSIFGDEKILPIFIDLSKCSDMFDGNNVELLEKHFIRSVILALREQIDNMFDEKFLLIFKRENPALTDLEFIERILVEGITIAQSKDVKVSSRLKYSIQDEIRLGLDLSCASADASLINGEEFERTSEKVEVKGLNVNDFLNRINEIRKKAQLDSIYIFIDEFSDLTNEEQEKFSILLKNLLGSKVNVFFKIGVITDRYTFGDNIIIGRDIFPVPLDLNEYVERYDGTVATIKKMQEFVEVIVLKRLEVFCPGLNFNDIFKADKSEVFYRIARESMGVTRTIGLILQNAWIQAQTKADMKIGLQEINYGIRSARKTYFKQFQGAIMKRLIPGFYMDIWSDILNKAISEKNKHPDRPASHMLVDPIRKDYLNILCENFLIHFLEEGRSSKYGGNYNLYSIDFDVCMDNNIKYAEVKDEFTAIRFVYDSILDNYDPYFLKDKVKSYKCTLCGRIYEDVEVAHVKIKRCFEDDERLEEIIHKSVPKTDGNYVEVEIKILGLISMLSEEEAKTAQEIADEVGCNVQKVAAWGSVVLHKKGLINIIKRNHKNYYYAKDEEETGDSHCIN